MSSDKEFVGFIWIGNDSGSRLSVWAPSIEAATDKAAEQHGNAHVIMIILFNDADPR